MKDIRDWARKLYGPSSDCSRNNMFVYNLVCLQFSFEKVSSSVAVSSCHALLQGFL